MKEPEKFMTPFGVLNVGMMFVASLYILVGILGYWKYGDDVESSVFLNLTTEVQG
jgi:proton-coupled amino acid transporter